MNADAPPKFLSLDFHTHFFPTLLRGRLRPSERTGTSFSSGLELQVSFAFCLVLFFIGLPIAISGKSIIGWIVGGIGALLINSILSRKDPPGYDYFLTGVFFFFVILGLTAGAFVGTLNHSLLLGILAGLWFQYLGWLAILAVIGMLCVDLVILSGALF